MNGGLNHRLATELFGESLDQENILLSVNSGSGICEARIEKGLPFRIREKWATIGDESRPWHIHLNMEEVKEARFVKEARSEGRQSYTACENYRKTLANKVQQLFIWSLHTIL
jgi:hypothetical protein